jgi:hypothetical protein
MTNPAVPPNRHVRRILAALEEGYKPSHPEARFDADQSSRWSIRVRVVDPDVEPLELLDRDGPVWEALDVLPDETFQMLSLVFVLAPDELGDSPTNRWFESERAARQRRRRVRADAARKRAGPSGQ